MKFLKNQFNSITRIIFSFLLFASLHVSLKGNDFSHLPTDVQNRINILVGDAIEEDSNDKNAEKPESIPPDFKESVKNRKDGVTETIYPENKIVFKKNNETVILTPDNKILYSDSPNKQPIVISNYKWPKVEQRIYEPPTRKLPNTAKPVTPISLSPSKLTNLDAVGDNATTPDNQRPRPGIQTGSADPENSVRRNHGDNFSWEDLSRRSSGVRHQISGDHLIEDGKSPFIPPPTYNPPVLDIPDFVKATSRNANLGINSIVRESGMIDYVLPDGTNATVYPGFDTVRYKSPGGKEEILKPNQDGIVKIEGKGFGESRIELNIDPAAGQTFVRNSSSAKDANGDSFVVRGVLNPDGTSLAVDNKGNSWDRAQNGEVRNSEWKNGDVTFKYNQKTNFTTLVDSSGRILAVKDKNDNEFRDLVTQKPVDVSKMVSKNISEIANEKGTSYNPAKISSLPQSPQSPNLERIPLSNVPTGTQRYEQFAKTIPVNNKNREEILKKIQEIRDLALGTTLNSKNLQELAEKEKKLNEAVEKEVLRQQNEKANEDLKTKRVELEKQITETEDTFAKAQKKADKERSRLDSSIKNLEEDRAERNRSMSSSTKSIQKARDDAAKRMLALEKMVVESEEKRLNGLISNALAEIEGKKGNYNLCPEGHPWDKCGHADLKKKWINERLLMLLGKDILLQLQELKAAKAKLAAAEQGGKSQGDSGTIVADKSKSLLYGGGNGDIPPPKPIYPPKPIFSSESASGKAAAWSQYYKDVAELEKSFQKDLAEFNSRRSKYENDMKDFGKKMNSLTKEKTSIDKPLESLKGNVSNLKQELARTKLLISATANSN